jgi:GNAT superfamily N-acetyltransferase
VDLGVPTPRSEPLDARDGVLEASPGNRRREARRPDHRGQIARGEKPGVEPEQVFASDECPAQNRRRVELQTDQYAPGSEDARGLLDDRFGPGHVVQGVEDQHGVDGLVRDGEPRRVPANPGDAVVPCLREHPRCGVDDDALGHVQRPDALAGPAPNVEDALNIAIGQFERGREFRPARGRFQIVQSGETIEDPHVAGPGVGCHTTLIGPDPLSRSPEVKRVPPVGSTMEYALLGWPPDGPTFRLDYRRFSYAGKFVMSATGKAVVRGSEADEILAAVAFNEDRTDADTLWLRYVTVREDHRGDGIGPRLCRFAAEHARERGYGQVRIAVNNPFAFEALSKAGFAFTGEETGIAELVMIWPGERTRESYQAGLDVYRQRDLSEAEREFLRERRDSDPPTTIRSVPADDA